MLKLLQINVTANWGSTGKIAEAIGNCAIRNGWKSYIAYGRMSNPSTSSMIKIGSKIDNYIHYAFNILFDMEGRSSIQATKNLVKRIMDIKPDVILLHDIHDHWLNYQILFGYLNQTDIKVVWTFHDCWAFTGHCYHFVHYNCMKWKTECGKCIQKNRFVDRSRENFILKKTLFTQNTNLTIVPCSNWMSNFVKDSFFKNNRIQVIQNGIDLKTFKVLHENRKKDGIFRVIAVSNVWHTTKGLYDILKLCKLLPDDYEIIIVGLSEKQIKMLPSRIRGITRTNDVTQLVKLYNEANVFINPSYADTFPTVNLEALACGLPVITYQTGGSPEAIDEKTGVIVSQGDCEGLAKAIIKLKKYPLSYKDCRKRAEECFDKDKCFKQYIQLFHKLLGQ